MEVIIQINSEKHQQKEKVLKQDNNIPTNRDCTCKKPSLILPVIFNVNQKIKK